MLGNHDHELEPVSANARRRAALWGACAMLVVIVAFYVLREHWGHALGVAPYLLLLACPLMHLFHGHGHHEHYDGKAGATPKE